MIADLHSRRKGWGIEASGLLLAYALDHIGIHWVEAKVFAYNQLSINALRRNGFRQEGVQGSTFSFTLLLEPVPAQEVHHG